MLAPSYYNNNKKLLLIVSLLALKIPPNETLFKEESVRFWFAYSTVFTQYMLQSKAFANSRSGPLLMILPMLLSCILEFPVDIIIESRIFGMLTLLAIPFDVWTRSDPLSATPFRHERESTVEFVG